MKVFKACMIIIKRRIGAFALYFVIFLALSVVMTAMSAERFTADFSALRPNFTVIDRDSNSAASQGLLAYLRAHGNETPLEDDKSALQDATFYHATDFIVFLPDGFQESLLSGGVPVLETVTTTESAKGYYAGSLVDRYCNLLRLSLAASEEKDVRKAVESVLESLSLETPVVKRQFGESAPMDTSYRIFNQMLCYILMVLNILCVTNITMALRRSDIRMRNLASPLKPRSMSVQQILSTGVMSVVAWLMLTALGFAIYGNNLRGVDARIIMLILLNSLVFSAVALAIATLVSSFVRSPNAQNAAANLISLGLCFLGGVFVPPEMLGEGILAVSRFLPSYWYLTALERVSELASFDEAALRSASRPILIQLVFAATFFCVALLLSKYQNRSESSFGSVRTEILS